MGNGPSRVGNNHSSGANAGSRISSIDSPASASNSVFGFTCRGSLASIHLTPPAARCGRIPAIHRDPRYRKVTRGTRRFIRP